MRILPIIILLLLLIITDIYTFLGLRANIMRNAPWLFNLIYIILSILALAGIIVSAISLSKGIINQPLWLNIIIGFSFSIIITKLLLSLNFLAEDVLRIFLWLLQSSLKFRPAEFLSRSYIWGVISLCWGIFILSIFNFGVIIGKYHYKVHNITIPCNNLPDSFNGFTIVQFSDLHLGSFDNIKKVKKGLHKAMQLNADMIVFTGDIVSNRAEEAIPYVDIIKQMKAPYGKFSIFGNHDYGDYVRWKSQTDKTKNMELLVNLKKQMGLNILNNQCVPIIKNNDTIYLAGVGNWGMPPFPQYGNLNTAMQNIPDSSFTILLSHDPTHFRAEVVNYNKNIGLTLSGHTHGMQFGFELGRYKWSPVKYKYTDWAGLYNQNNHYLYVNRGFGNIGYPGRVGIRPEITVIKLMSK